MSLERDAVFISVGCRIALRTAVSYTAASCGVPTVRRSCTRWFSSNFNVEVHAYVKNGKFCVVNNTYEPQKTVVYRGDGSSFSLEMEANEIKWYNI